MDATILDYAILQATTPASLNELVQEALSSGYQPWGTLSVDGGGFYQSMVRNQDWNAIRVSVDRYRRRGEPDQD